MADGGDYLQQLVLLVVAQYDAHARYGGNLLGVVLGKAAYHGHDGIWILRCGLPDGISAFFFGHRGNRAGIYHVNVGLFVVVHNVKTCRCEFLL